MVGSWVARWLRLRGREVTLVHNITDVNDKIYDAAPGASAARAAEATEWYLEDVGRFELDAVDSYPKVTETMDEIVAFIAELVERGYAYEVEGDVYFRVGRWPEYGRLSGQRPDQMEHEDAEPAQGGSARLRALEGEQAGRGHLVGVAVGSGPARLAHRVLGDGGAAARADVRDPRRRARPRLPAPRERAGAVARARARFAQIWMHNGMLRFTGEKMSKSVGNVETIQDALDRWGRETLLVFFLTAHWRKPIDYSEETLGAAARTETAARGLPQAVASRRGEGDGSGSRPRWTTTSTRPRRSRSCTSGATTSCSGGRSTSSGWRRSPSGSEAPAGDRRARRAPPAARGPSATSTRPTGCAPSSRPPAGRLRDEAGGYRLVPRA